MFFPEMNLSAFSRVCIIAVLFSSRVAAQEGATAQEYKEKIRTCLTPVPPAAWDSWFNAKVEERKMQSLAMKQQVNSYTIPVIVHVIHGGEAPGTSPNISQAQVNSQISALNADFSGNGFNVNNIPSVFLADKADCKITFSMAQKDPQGKALAEPGIDRVDWHDLGPGNNPLLPPNSFSFQPFFDDSIKPKTIWDPRYYLNIWVSDVKSTVDLLGYATFPAGTGMGGIFPGTTGGSSDDGVWIWAGSFGTTGSLHPQYNKGRTATHEIGHWLGLRHLWGDSSCGDDYCSDTPKQQTSNLNCPSYPKTSCSNGPHGEMFMDFMDYCDDQCLSMFTWDQMSRMHIAMDNGTFRKSLTASSHTLCNLPAQQPIASFTATDSACANAPVQMQNSSTGMPGPKYSWDVSPHEGYMIFPSLTAEEPVFVFTQPGSYVVTMQAMNTSGASSSTTQIEVKDCGIPAGITEHTRRRSCVISPNPSSGMVVISGEFEKIPPVGVDIFDSLGSLVFSGTYAPGAISLELSELPCGLYFASVSQQNRKEVIKLLISR